MIPFTLKEVAEVTGGRLAEADPDAVVTGVQVDSRQVAAGDLFVALPGSRTDGGLFADAAARAGAAAIARAAEAYGGPVAAATELEVHELGGSGGLKERSGNPPEEGR